MNQLYYIQYTDNAGLSWFDDRSKYYPSLLSAGMECVKSPYPTRIMQFDVPDIKGEPIDADREVSVKDSAVIMLNTFVKVGEKG
ncbi:hypothetical protein N9955_00410 [bacterium]|nr:hypothetical protein [bacterium]